MLLFVPFSVIQVKQKLNQWKVLNQTSEVQDAFFISLNKILRVDNFPEYFFMIQYTIDLWHSTFQRTSWHGKLSCIQNINNVGESEGNCTQDSSRSLVILFLQSASGAYMRNIKQDMQVS